MPRSRGRWSGTRSITIVISNSPTDSADSTRPQPCSPMVSLATAGPRVNSAPIWMALRKPNASTTTHSQVTLRKNTQPSRRSASIPVLLDALGGGYPHAQEQRGGQRTR